MLENFDLQEVSTRQLELNRRASVLNRRAKDLFYLVKMNPDDSDLFDLWIETESELNHIAAYIGE